MQKITVKDFFLLFLLLSASICFSQSNSAIPTNIRASQALERIGDGVSASDLIYGIPLPEGKVIGDSYLSKEWNKASLLLYENDKMIEGYPIRYDIKTNDIEVKSKNGIKVIAGNKVRSFVWNDSIEQPVYYINAKDYKTNKDVSLAGFYEILSDGSISALMRTSIIMKKPNYNVALDVGSRDTQILKKNEFYYLKDQVVSPLPSSKKKFIALFGDKSKLVDRFISGNSLSVKKQVHIKRIFNYYNNLVAQSN